MMNIHGTKVIGIVALLVAAMLLLPMTARSEVPSVGNVGLGYTCTDTTSTDHRGEPTGNKKRSNNSDRFGLDRFNQVTDGSSKVIVLQEQSEKRKNEVVRVRPAEAAATETKEEENSPAPERKVRDHRKK